MASRALPPLILLSLTNQSILKLLDIKRIDTWYNLLSNSENEDNDSIALSLILPLYPLAALGIRRRNKTLSTQSPFSRTRDRQPPINRSRSNYVHCGSHEFPVGRVLDSHLPTFRSFCH
jgi:hypothetical protein